MPDAVADPVIAGFCGKLPARADFVRVGLPRAFTDPWDDWLTAVLVDTRDRAGAAWLPAFLEAPVWRFSLPAALCGPRAVLGLTMPSVDRAGRYFPLTFAALSPSGFTPEANTAWLDRCEEIGRAALETDLAPDRVRDALGADTPVPAQAPAPLSRWWSEGSVRVPPMDLRLRHLPDTVSYAVMLGLADGATCHESSERKGVQA